MARNTAAVTEAMQEMLLVLLAFDLKTFVEKQHKQLKVTMLYICNMANRV